MDPVTVGAIVTEVMGSDSFAKIRESLRRGDRTGAAAQADDAITKIDTERAKRLDEQTKKDVRYQLLAFAEAEDRPVMTAVLGMQSAERVGQNLVKATWALVIASGALVLATVVLVIITATKSLSVRAKGRAAQADPDTWFEGRRIHFPTDRA
jgi:hypothetical protein